jgi:hypothetical protein
MDAGAIHVAVVNPTFGGEQVLTQMPGRECCLRAGFNFERYIIGLPVPCADLRDDLAARLGDDKCRWFHWPFDGDVVNAMASARPMWTDEIATIDDIPEPSPVQAYTGGFPALDQHGFRLVLPAFMPIIGPYGSGKSVLLRQLLVNLWRQHQWRCLLTSFEEKVKPRFQRDLRRHLLNCRLQDASEGDIALVDAEIRKGFRFLLRKRNTTLDLDRLVALIEFRRWHSLSVCSETSTERIGAATPRGWRRCGGGWIGCSPRSRQNDN